MKKNIFVLIAALYVVNGALAVDFKNLTNSVIQVKKAGIHNRFHTIQPRVGKESFPLGLGNVLFVKEGTTTLQYNLKDANQVFRSFTNASFNSNGEVTLSGISFVNDKQDAALRGAGYRVSRPNRIDPEVLLLSIPGVRAERVY